MKSRMLWFVSAVALLAGVEIWGRFDARLLAANDPVPVPRDRTFFTYNFFADVELDRSSMRPRAPFPRTSSTILIGANSTICTLDGRTGRTSSPLRVYSAGAPGLVNFTVAPFNEQHVLFTAPGGASSNPMAAFVYGPPHSLLGDFGMIDGGHEFGVSIASGNASGDATPELFVATANGGPGTVHMISPGRDAVTTFYAFDPGYRGGIRLAAGDMDGDGFDELVASQAQGCEVRFFRFIDDAPVLLGAGCPFAHVPNNGPFIDLFDVNNDGRDEVIFGSGGGDPLVRIMSLDGQQRILDQLRPFTGNQGVGVATGLLDGQLALAVTPQTTAPEGNDFFALFLYHLETGFRKTVETRPFLTLEERQAIRAIMHPFAGPPPRPQ